MSNARHGRQAPARAFLARLARDVRANTIAIMGMALIPLAGMVGGGVDISRMYIVKTRLQHACDAGALAGRKTMGGGTWSQRNYAPRAAAEKFFDANISADPYGASNLTRSFSENAGKVMGTASATLPMTVMRIFGRQTETLEVTCDAEMRLPNTDVMFVLDVTGSMASKAKSSDSDTKIQSLRKAVKCFYEIVARLDTDAVCDGGNPSGGTGDQVQIRFGFVPYSTNVNVGKLLPTSYFADSWVYQSREPQFTTSSTTDWVRVADSGAPSGTEDGSWSAWENYGSAQYFSCPAYPGNSRVGPTTRTYDTEIVVHGNSRSWETRTVTGYVETEYQEIATGMFGWACQIQVRTRSTGNYTAVRHQEVQKTVTQNTFNQWHYGPIRHDISGLKSGTNWNNSVELPIGPNGTMQSVNWDGCIEERSTVKQSSYSPIPTNAKDLQIDLIPDPSDATTLWAPALPDAIYTRAATSGSAGNTSGWNASEQWTGNDYRNNSNYFCPTEARKMQMWPSASSFSSYVNGLQPNGNTYHDIGLIWGARLLSPTGLFRSENEFTPQGGEIERHLIFMTDGDTVANATDYAAYGLPWYDRRQTNANSVPSSNDLSNQVNARFTALCTAIKNKNITLWVISFGDGSNSTTEDRLEACATPGRYFVARDSAELQQTFRSIADQISQLRLTK